MAMFKPGDKVKPKLNWAKAEWGLGTNPMPEYFTVRRVAMSDFVHDEQVLTFTHEPAHIAPHWRASCLERWRPNKPAKSARFIASGAPEKKVIYEIKTNKDTA